jgi:hypothetical protein
MNNDASLDVGKIIHIGQTNSFQEIVSGLIKWWNELPLITKILMCWSMLRLFRLSETQIILIFSYFTVNKFVIYNTYFMMENSYHDDFSETISYKFSKNTEYFRWEIACLLSLSDLIISNYYIFVDYIRRMIFSK